MPDGPSVTGAANTTGWMLPNGVAWKQQKRRREAERRANDRRGGRGQTVGPWWPTGGQHLFHSRRCMRRHLTGAPAEHALSHAEYPGRREAENGISDVYRRGVERRRHQRTGRGGRGHRRRTDQTLRRQLQLLDRQRHQRVVGSSGEHQGRGRRHPGDPVQKRQRRVAAQFRCPCRSASTTRSTPEAAWTSSVPSTAVSYDSIGPV